MTARKARLTWGAVALISEGALDGLPYVIEASADGTNWGNPEAVITAVQSRLQDGSLAAVDSYGNRSAPIYLQVTSDTYDGLDAGEEALVAEEQRPGYNTLTWTPDEDDAANTVFDVVYANLDFQFDDLDELRRTRSFIATLNCYPHPRADTQVVATAPPPPSGGGTTTSIDAMSSASGWTGRYWTPSRDGAGTSVTPSSGGSTVSVSTTGITAPLVLSATRTSASVSLTGTPYVWVDWRRVGSAGRGLAYVKAYFNGTEVTAIATVASPTAGYSRTYFQPGVSSFTTFELEVRVLGLTFPDSSAYAIEMDQLSRTDVSPAPGTRRQLFRTLPVAGTMRTQGQLAIEHDTDGLGEVLAYVYVNDGSGYQPSLRQFYTSGGTVTTDSSLVSGGRNMLDTQVVYDIPAKTLPPGSYRVYARLVGGTAGTVTLNLTANTRVNSTNLPGGQTASATVTVDTTSGTGWHIFDLCGFELPTNSGPASSAGATVRITIVDADTSGVDVNLDEVWLFSEDTGGLTHVDCSTGTGAAGGPSNRLWLDPATVTNDGQPAVYVGHSADRSDAFNPGDNVKGWTPPTFEPDSANVFTVCTNALDAEVTLSHYPRFRHNVRAVT